MASGFGTNIKLQPAIAVPASIAASGTYDSGLFQCPGPGISVGYKCAGATSYSAQRYLDSAKVLPVGAAIAGTGTGGTATTFNINDGVPWLYFEFIITDTSSATNAISALAIVASSAGH